MTELEVIARAQIYMEKLANGINPLDNSRIPEEDVVRQVRISKCFLFVADVLRRVMENGGIPAPAQKAKEQKLPFDITCAQRESVVRSKTPVPIGEIANRLNTAVSDPKMKRIGYADIAGWLMEIGLLEAVRLPNGRERKRPSAASKDVGISTEIRVGVNGTYEVVVLDQNAQQFVLDHIDAVIERANTAYEFQGKPWTAEQEALLIELYQRGDSAFQISRVLKRQPSSIRARIRRLGKQGRLNEQVY